MASDSVNLIAELGGETVTYTPSGGVAVTFLAYVDRSENGQPVHGGGHPYTGKVRTVHIPHDATDGVESIKEGHDTVSFKHHPHDSSATTYKVAKILSQDVGMVSSDGGMFVVECHA